MKILIACAVSLLVGCVIGYYIGYSYYEKRVTNRAVEQMMLGIESSDGVQAARAIRSIELIGSGETQKAVQLLSRPIADYYCFYSIHAGTNEDRPLKILTMIEQLVRTNKIVADEISNQMAK